MIDLRIKTLSAFFSLSLFSTSLFAAQAVTLSHSEKYFLPKETKELSRATDDQGMTHIRMQQTYRGYPVLGGNYIIHKKANESLTHSINGVIYNQLDADLQNPPEYIFTEEQQQNTLDYLFKNHIKQTTLTAQPQSKLVVYVDHHGRAHFAYDHRFTVGINKPSFLIDAIDYTIYQQWNDLRTSEIVAGGGAGGNGRTDWIYYDGASEKGHKPTFFIERDPTLKLCYMRNDKAVLKAFKNNFENISFPCPAPSPFRNGLYWFGYYDSESVDTLYAAVTTVNLFDSWFHMPVWHDKFGKAKKLVYFMHDDSANASFHPDGYIVVGDSRNSKEFYAFTTLDIIAHEIGHGITYQHSNLEYYGQSGAVNESFSDMTGKVAQFYETGEIKNWDLAEITVDPNKALRYMDHPNKDCPETGEIRYGFNCSVEHTNQMPDDFLKYHMEVHHASGLYNRFFYLLSTTPNWDVKKAYQLMLHANRFYWTEFSNFCQASRGVLLAAKQLQVEEEAVVNAFSQVGIDAKNCIDRFDP